MLARIIQHDWRNLKADRTIWAVAAILLVAIGYGVFNGAQWVRFQRATLEQANTEERERFEALSSGPAVAADTVGRRSGLRYAVLPPGPLAALTVGQSDLYPYYFKVSTASKDTFLNNDEIENPVHLLSGRFDAAFVIVYLFPLVILALSYNLISAEREAGTLVLALSQPVSLRRLVMGKVLLRFSVVAALAAGLTLAGAMLGGVSLTSSDAWIRLGLWCGVAVIYGAFWFALGLAVNAFGSGSTTNAMALSAAWLALVLLVPSLLNVAAKTLHPVPSRVELVNGMRTASVEASAQGSVLLAKYLEDHPDLTTSNEAEIAAASATSFAVQEDVERRMQPLLDEFNQQLENQQAVMDRYRFLSPAILAQAALSDLAGTGTARYQHFLKLTDRFHETWKEWFTPRVLRRGRVRPEEVGSIPAFAFVEESLDSVVGRAGSGLLGLAVFAVAALVASLAVLRRYQFIHA